MNAELHESPSSPSSAPRRLLGKLSRTSPPEHVTPDGARGSDEPTGAVPSTAIATTLPETEAGEETPETPTKRWAAKYATPEKLEEAYLHLQRELGRLRNELGEERAVREELELYLHGLLNAASALTPEPVPAVPVLDVTPADITPEVKAKVVDALAAIHGIKREAHG